MKVLSLFDGMSCGQIALNRIGITPETYYAAEIDKPAIEVTKDNYPNTVHLGDVTKWHEWPIDWASIDLLIGGSPCQGFSFAGKQLAFDDPRSKLFFVFLDILSFLKVVNPRVKFMLENVKMKKEHLDVITEKLGVEPVNICGGDIGYCYRDRWYWCNWSVSKPQKVETNLADIIDDGFVYPAAITGRRINPETGKRDDYNPDVPIIQYLYSLDHGKARCMTTVNKDCLLTNLPNGTYPGAYDQYEKGVHWREPTIIESCLFHGVPTDYFRNASDNAARILLAQGWHVDVIAHIFREGLL